jgi:hypothetical protein
MGDMVGRKWGIAASSVLAFNNKWAMFVVGRVIAGICVVCYRFVTMCSSSEPDSYVYFFLGSGIMLSAHVSIRGI